MRTWEDPNPRRPAIGLGIGLLAIAILLLIAIWALEGKAGATTVRCGGPCPTVPTTTATTIATTTTATTLPTTTTAKPTTTTCSDCVPNTQGVTTTTVPRTTTTSDICTGCTPPPGATTVPGSTTTTTAAATTTIAPTTTVTAGVRGAEVPDTDAVDQTVPAVPASTLPVTGGDSAWLFVLGGCLVALGLLIVAWTRPV